MVATGERVAGPGASAAVPAGYSLFAPAVAVGESMRARMLLPVVAVEWVTMPPVSALSPARSSADPPSPAGVPARQFAGWKPAEYRDAAPHSAKPQPA